MNTPTLCLVMDGEKIASYEIETEDIWIKHHADKLKKDGSAFTLRTIPLSLCAVAEEMRECIEHVSDYMWRAENETGVVMAHGIDKCQSLLSRINPQ